MPVSTHPEQLSFDTFARQTCANAPNLHIAYLGQSKEVDTVVWLRFLKRDTEDVVKKINGQIPLPPPHESKVTPEAALAECRHISWAIFLFFTSFHTKKHPPNEQNLLFCDIPYMTELLAYTGNYDTAARVKMGVQRCLFPPTVFGEVLHHFCNDMQPGETQHFIFETPSHSLTLEITYQHSSAQGPAHLMLTMRDCNHMNLYIHCIIKDLETLRTLDARILFTDFLDRNESYHVHGLYCLLQPTSSMAKHRAIQQYIFQKHMDKLLDQCATHPTHCIRSLKNLIYRHRWLLANIFDNIKTRTQKDKWLAFICLQPDKELSPIQRILTLTSQCHYLNRCWHWAKTAAQQEQIICALALVRPQDEIRKIYCDPADIELHIALATRITKGKPTLLTIIAAHHPQHLEKYITTDYYPHKLAIIHALCDRSAGRPGLKYVVDHNPQLLIGILNYACNIQLCTALILALYNSGKPDNPFHLGQPWPKTYIKMLPVFTKIFNLSNREKFMHLESNLVVCISCMLMRIIKIAVDNNSQPPLTKTEVKSLLAEKTFSRVFAYEAFKATFPDMLQTILDAFALQHQDFAQTRTAHLTAQQQQKPTRPDLIISPYCHVAVSTL